MRVVFVLALCLAAVAAAPKNAQRIVGGTPAKLGEYPGMAGILATNDYINYAHTCAGTIINNRSILTSAHCVRWRTEQTVRVLVGAIHRDQGGFTYNANRLFWHSEYTGYGWIGPSDYNIGIIRVTGPIVFGDTVRSLPIAGPNYNVPDGQEVYAAGWGYTEFMGEGSYDLLHVQLLTVNQESCREFYEEERFNVTENMICSGHSERRGQCDVDWGTGLLHNNVVIGLYAWDLECGEYPAVNTRVSRFTSWIQERA